MSVDDYLDLLNYAKAINDGQWQADIIEHLKQVTTVREPYAADENVHELWSRFDDINLKLLELFDKLRENESAGNSYRWKEQIWELKLERITLAKQIQGRYIKIR
ncbi:hypothetical protein [Paenibacillus camerounensis]|uniref:hypothetical protein n=1 Tax=Paenibacillus camerounensis TaxID=1243663 RepID=UPI0005A7583A|nr:hypothetical protein [Paenibacillus camerounensis]